MRHLGKDIPLETYHGVPSGWYASEIVATHTRLGGTHQLFVPHATEPGAPAWLPEREEWLQYRSTLHAVADGVRQNDPACIELGVRFIELRHIGSYSGFLREKLARRLAKASLGPSQQSRLHVHFRSLLLSGERTQEFKPFARLWRQFISTSAFEELVADVRRTRGESAAQWIESHLRPQGHVMPN